MPAGDRTGPMGEGSMTGRRMGFCAGYNTVGGARGFAYGRGRGNRFGHGYGFRDENLNVPAPQPVAAVQPENITGLKAEIEGLKNNINAILERLDSQKADKEKG